MKKIALYIHIPFCKQKCFYCDFTSFSNKEGRMKEYATALGKEIESTLQNKVSSIFIGGGTPTYLSLDGWQEIQNCLKNISRDPDIEFTVEGNPGTFTREKLALFKKIGVNRLSIGLQAWQKKHLKALGRIHTTEDFLKSFQMARQEGFENINIDLMFGLPNQSMEEWAETLEQVTLLQPEHLSCYSLIVEEGTPYYTQYENGSLLLPDEELEREMWQHTLKMLKAKGYNQYEISNFCREGMECKHNLVYWNLEEYLGVGAGAHSYMNGIRYNNSGSIEEYINMMKEKGNAIVEEHKNKEEDEIEEFIFMGLRKISGISKIDFKMRFKKEIYEVYSEVLEKYITLGLLIAEEDRIFLSAEGLEISNSILSEFILEK